MFAVANKQQFKIKMYKKQIEEAEEIIAPILAKFREAQQELEEANKQEHGEEKGISVLNTLLREEVGTLWAREGFRPFPYWGASCLSPAEVSLLLWRGICLWQAGVSRAALSRGKLTVLFSIEMIKDHLSLVLNDTQSEPIQYLIFCQRMIYSIFDSILFYPRFNSKDYSIKSKTLEKKNSGDSIQ